LESGTKHVDDGVGTKALRNIELCVRGSSFAETLETCTSETTPTSRTRFIAIIAIPQKREEHSPARDARVNWESMAPGSQATIVEGRGKCVDLSRTVSQLVQTQKGHQMIKTQRGRMG
jgi:hypothetical protein